MFRLAFISLFIVVCLGVKLPQTIGIENRIVGGNSAKIEQHPYQVALFLYEGTIDCGGSLIAKNWVLTAANCIQHARISVRVGSDDYAAGGKVYAVKNIHIHPKFDVTNFDYDFALLELKDEIKSSAKTQFIKLAEEGEELPSGSFVNITGWGATETNFQPNSLQVVKVPVVKQEDCVKSYESIHEVTSRMFCAGYLGIGGKDACQGDVGGPVVYEGKQYGIVSWGRDCGEPDYPGVYAKVSNQRSWIKTVSGV